jgi:transcriptional regulator with XRE-family HTH domain
MTDGTDSHAPLNRTAFRAWRRRLGLTQEAAAEALGLKRRMIQYYESGGRDGRPVEIPKTVRLACASVARGVGDYDGETELPRPGSPSH